MRLLVPLLLAGCSTGGIPLDTGDTGADDTARVADTSDTDDTDTDDPGPVDRDADGATADADCDDGNADVHPGATEAWNAYDDDCDGVVDADGAWSGDVRLAASAVYEGRRYDFALDCPFAGTRFDGGLDFTITCTPDPDDENAQRLLGATLTITPDDAPTYDDHWADAVVFTSANGWDSDGEGTIEWSSLDAAEVEVTMSGVSLAASGSGDIARE